MSKGKAARPKLVPVTFKADAETIEAIDVLTEEAAVKDGVLDGGRSFVIRRAIKSARVRLERRS